MLDLLYMLHEIKNNKTTKQRLAFLPTVLLYVFYWCITCVLATEYIILD